MKPVKYALSTDEAWRTIRALRPEPPMQAGTDENRRKVFAAAMKQSEQLFRSADASGYEIKPLLLYYGLNQAARAIMAAGAQPGERWQFSGHGIHCQDLNSERPGDIKVLDQKAGGFKTLAGMLRCPTLPYAVPLRELWVSLPEGADVPLERKSQLWSAVKIQRTGSGRPPHDFMVPLPVGPENPIAIVQWLPMGVRTLHAEDASRRLHARYPSMADFQPARSVDGQLGYVLGKQGLRSGLQLYHEGPRDRLLPVTGLAIFACGGSDVYVDPDEISTWVLPTVGANTAAQHPLIAWWAVLYTLSMLARYEPSTWTRMLDIDSSPEAPAIEYMLDEAHRACLNLIVALVMDNTFGIDPQLLDQRQRDFDEIEELARQEYVRRHGVNPWQRDDTSAADVAD